MCRRELIKSHTVTEFDLYKRVKPVSLRLRVKDVVKRNAVCVYKNWNKATFSSRGERGEHGDNVGDLMPARPGGGGRQVTSEWMCLRVVSLLVSLSLSLSLSLFISSRRLYVTPSVGGATTKSLGLWLAGSLRARKCCAIAQTASRPTQQPKAVATPMSLSSTTSTTALSGTR